MIIISIINSLCLKREIFIKNAGNVIKSSSLSHTMSVSVNKILNA